jgi:hypothetical protein
VLLGWLPVLLHSAKPATPVMRLVPLPVRPEMPPGLLPVRPEMLLVVSAGRLVPLPVRPVMPLGLLLVKPVMLLVVSAVRPVLLLVRLVMLPVRLAMRRPMRSPEYRARRRPQGRLGPPGWLLPARQLAVTVATAM